MTHPYIMPPRRPMTTSIRYFTLDPDELIAYHMQHARSCRAVLNRIRDSDHERRRATVKTMQDHVTKARQLNRTIVRIRRDNATKQEQPR